MGSTPDRIRPINWSNAKIFRPQTEVTSLAASRADNLRGAEPRHPKVEAIKRALDSVVIPFMRY